MTPALDLARRFVAAGAPEADDNTVIVIPGVSYRSIATGLVYDRATKLPLLTDPSWLGWTLAEVERRRYRCLYATAPGGGCRVAVWFPGSDHCERSWDAPDIPTALVAMLESTTPLRPATDRDSE